MDSKKSFLPSVKKSSGGDTRLSQPRCTGNATLNAVLPNLFFFFLRSASADDTPHYTSSAEQMSFLFLHPFVVFFFFSKEKTQKKSL
jgi:hypothetical protein